MKLGKQTLTRLFGVTLFMSSLLLIVVSFNAYAQPTHTSPNYGVDEVFFGSGGVNDANSANFNARASLGDLGVGNTASSNFQAYAGFTTDATPFLEVTVNSVAVDLGIQDTSFATTGTATFTVRAWLADGYNVVTASDAPINSSYEITTLSTPAASSPGTEQFGINLVANTDPANVGADPLQIPDNTFSYGYAATGYDTANQYKYVKGDTIAASDQSTSVTQYTISYLMNVSGVTPGGTYVMNHNLVVTGTY